MRQNKATSCVLVSTVFGDMGVHENKMLSFFIKLIV